MDFSRFKVLTFDCYGTLVDWESGILGALRPILRRHRCDISDQELLEVYAGLEAAAEDGPFRPYRSVLENVVHALGERLGFSPSAEEARSLPESIRDWQPFSDTIESLRRLKTRYRLAILSNVDDDLFAHTAKRLEVPFEFVITAQQCRSYKPSLNNFRTAVERIGLPKEQVLHVAQSLFHDIAPAHELGIPNAWVNRRQGMQGAGATVPATATPDVEVADLKTLADMATGR